jgi:hypothetical protein
MIDGCCIRKPMILLNCLLLHTWPHFLPLPVLPLRPYLLHSSPNGATMNVNSWVAFFTILPTLYLRLSPYHHFVAQPLHHLHPSPLDNWVNNATINMNAYITLKATLPSYDLLPLPFSLHLPLPTFFPLLSTPHHCFIAQCLYHLHCSPLDNWVNNAAMNVNNYIMLMATLLSSNLLLLPFPLRLPLCTFFPLLSPLLADDSRT